MVSDQILKTTYRWMKDGTQIISYVGFVPSSEVASGYSVFQLGSGPIKFLRLA
jgi:hypothetical protein